MRTALIAVLAAFAIAGCGGESIEADEVPGGPAALSLPPDAALPTVAADADASATATPTATATAAAGTSGTTTAPSAAAPSTGTGTSTTGGSTAPATGGTNTTGGADGNFEDFCAQNPGAC
jgi:hypothetical protein